jgi:AAA domain
VRRSLSLKVRNSREYINPETFRIVALLYGLPGSGKTSWIGTLPHKDTIIAACETGLGKGVLTIADKGFDVVEPDSLVELEEFCRGRVGTNKKALVLDSLSAMAKTFIKETALRMPRKMGDSDKRRMGIPELDDYGTIGELTRKLLNILISSNPDKHIIVTATEKYDRPNENDPPGTESLIGPDLAGQMFLGAPAMFDFVLRLRTRPKLRDPKDPRSRYGERYFLTQQESGTIAKCRSNSRGVPLLDREEVFDQHTGQGGFQYILDKLLQGYGFRTDRAAEAEKALA